MYHLTLQQYDALKSYFLSEGRYSLIVVALCDYNVHRRTAPTFDRLKDVFSKPITEIYINPLCKQLLTLTLSTRMPYWTSWPDNTDAVAVQLDKMIINA